MGEEGARNTDAAAAMAGEAVTRLGPLGDVTARKMFGGYGIFEGDVMFALVTAEGGLYLRVDDGTRPKYEAAGSPSTGECRITPCRPGAS